MDKNELSNSPKEGDESPETAMDPTHSSARPESAEEMEVELRAKEMPDISTNSPEKLSEDFLRAKKQLREVQERIEKSGGKGGYYEKLLADRKELLREINAISEKVTGEDLDDNIDKSLREMGFKRVSKAEKKAKEIRRAKREILDRDYQKAKKVILESIPEEDREEFEEPPDIDSWPEEERKDWFRQQKDSLNQYLQEQDMNPYEIEKSTYFRLVANGIRVDQTKKEGGWAHGWRLGKNIGIGMGAGGAVGLVGGFAGSFLGVVVGGGASVLYNRNKLERSISVPIGGGKTIKFNSEQDFVAWANKQEDKIAKGRVDEDGEQMSGEILAEAVRRATTKLKNEDGSERTEKDIKSEVVEDQKMFAKVELEDRWSTVKEKVHDDAEEWEDWQLKDYRKFTNSEKDPNPSADGFYALVNSGYIIERDYILEKKKRIPTARMRVSLDGQNFTTYTRKEFIELVRQVSQNASEKIDHEAEERVALVDNVENNKKILSQVKKECRRDLWRKAREKMGLKEEEKPPEEKGIGEPEKLPEAKDQEPERSFKQKIAEAGSIDELCEVLLEEREISRGNKGKQDAGELSSEIKQIRDEAVKNKKCPSKSKIKETITTAHGMGDKVHELIRQLVDEGTEGEKSTSEKTAKESEPKKAPEMMAPDQVAEKEENLKGMTLKELLDLGDDPNVIDVENALNRLDAERNKGNKRSGRILEEFNRRYEPLYSDMHAEDPSVYDERASQAVIQGMLDKENIETPSDEESEPKRSSGKEARPAELAESIEKDPRFASIKKELIDYWLKQNPGQDLLTAEGQDFQFGVMGKPTSKSSQMTLEDRVKEEFRRRFPEDYTEYQVKKIENLPKIGAEKERREEDLPKKDVEPEKPKAEGVREILGLAPDASAEDIFSFAENLYFGLKPQKDQETAMQYLRERNTKKEAFAKILRDKAGFTIKPSDFKNPDGKKKIQAAIKIALGEK